MKMSMDRSTPGPILRGYRVPLGIWGVVLTSSGPIWMLSFGGAGGALAVGWVRRKRLRRDRTVRLGRTL